MKGTSSKDIMLIFVFALITTLLTSLSPFNIPYLDISLFILIFLVSGYTLISVLYPEETYGGLLKKPVLIIELSVFLTVLISVILKYSSVGLQFRDLTLILSLITMILSFTAYILRINYSKPLSGGKSATSKTAEKSIPTTSLPLKQTLSKNLIIFTLLSLLMLITVLVPPMNKNPLWMVPGSLFICFIPGYLLFTVMFPKNDDLELVERLALGCGSSLILTSLIGLAFNYTPWKIRLELILIVLAILSLIFCIIAFLRMKKLSSQRILYVPKLDKIMAIFLIICVILTIGTTAYALFKPANTTPIDTKKNFTEFYVKEINLNDTNYNFNLASGKKANLTMVLINKEGSAVNYRLIVTVNNTILKQDNITLQNNQKIEIPLSFTAGTPGQKKMEFLLYRLPDQNSYIKRSLMLNIT